MSLYIYALIIWLLFHDYSSLLLPVIFTFLPRFILIRHIFQIAFRWFASSFLAVVAMIFTIFADISFRYFAYFSPLALHDTYFIRYFLHCCHAIFFASAASFAICFAISALLAFLPFHWFHMLSSLISLPISFLLSFFSSFLRRWLLRHFFSFRYCCHFIISFHAFSFSLIFSAWYYWLLPPRWFSAADFSLCSAVFALPLSLFEGFAAFSALFLRLILPSLRCYLLITPCRRYIYYVFFVFFIFSFAMIIS